VKADCQSSPRELRTPRVDDESQVNRIAVNGLADRDGDCAATLPGGDRRDDALSSARHIDDAQLLRVAPLWSGPPERDALPIM